MVGLTTASVLGGLLLARRTGPMILYWRILDEAPAVEEGAEVETARRTFTRTLAPALALPLALAATAPVLVGAALLMAGRTRAEVLDGLLALAPPAAGFWTIVCGLAGLRMAAYFERWEELRGRVAVCPPRRAGVMRPVYRVVAPRPARREGSGAIMGGGRLDDAGNRRQ